MAENLKELAKSYLQLQAEVDELNAQLKERKQKMDELKSHAWRAMESAGTDAVVTEYGKFKRKEKTSFAVNDKSTLGEWVLSTGRYDVFYSRVNSKICQELLKEENSLPDGVTMNTWTEVSFSIK